MNGTFRLCDARRRGRSRSSAGSRHERFLLRSFVWTREGDQKREQPASGRVLAENATLEACAAAGDFCESAASRRQGGRGEAPRGKAAASWRVLVRNGKPDDVQGWTHSNRGRT